MQLDDIYKPIEQDLHRVQQRLRAAVDVDIPLLSRLLAYVLESGGKQIRPAVTLFVGKLYHYDVDLLSLAAAAIELLHTSTLVHDDIVDNSTQRRNKGTTNYLWGEDRAVLLGDYLFGKSANLITETGDIRVMRLFSRTVMTVSSGELVYSASPAVRQTRESYFHWIGAKTAYLFSMAARGGAILSQAPDQAIEACTAYGYNLGMAFQVTDDILDFMGDGAELGKPLGSDLSRGIFTLPTILFLEGRVGADNIVQKTIESTDPGDIKLVMDEIRQSRAIADCADIARNFSEKACHALEELPHEESWFKLVDLAHYILERRQ
ncbi:MAG: polyprenyl synthetase family protein [Dehalococcoidia bacterium]|nr:polyprenyl synthetase family protein [Dehalococcoidia bacterium]